MPSGTFGSTGDLPWGHHFYYTMPTMDVPSDHKFFVTVVYSGSNTDADRYLKHWMQNHPALRHMQGQVNYREITTADPIYRSYLNVSVVQVPAIVITTPPTNGPFGETVYLAYGEYLPSDPNEIAQRMETAMQEYTQTYRPQQINQVPPTPLIDVDIQRTPRETPVVVQPEPEPQLPADALQFVNIGLLAVILMVLLRRR